MSDQSVLLELIRQHTDDDTRRFASVEKKLTSIETKLDSLLESRAQGRGAWRATATIAGAAGSIAGALVGWFLR